MEREFEETPLTALSSSDNITASENSSMIIPISKIGTTSPDVGKGNILQNLEQNINVGTKKIQFVFTGQGQVSKGPSAYGKQVRLALKEKAKSAGVELTGLELSPSMVSGLAGFDRQNQSLSDARRQADLGQVRDAIRFAADIGGGGVDLWSQEFNRSIVDADWNKDKKFFGISQEELGKDGENTIKQVKYLVDSRTGDPVRESVVYTNDKLFLPKYKTAKDFSGLKKLSDGNYVDATGAVIDKDDCVDIEGRKIDKNDLNQFSRLVPKLTEKGELEVDNLKWSDVKTRTDEYNKNKSESEKKTPEEWFYRQRQITELTQAQGQVSYYGHDLRRLTETLEDLRSKRDFAKKIEQNMDASQKEEWIRSNVIETGRGTPSKIKKELLSMDPSQAMEEEMSQLQEQIRGYRENAVAAKMKFQEVQERIDNVKTPQHFALAKSIEGYADMGIEAMQVTKERGLYDKKNGKPIYIGPEIGWAGDGYGGHPDEFITLIKESREKMANKLIASGAVPDAEARELAKNHIKGMLDTSHLAMWYKHFRRKEGQSDAAHLKEFNGWMKEKVGAMVDAGVLGGVQVVDSITGEHSHLPAGQGQFEVADLVKEMVGKGFKGDIIAEGHEEEGFGQGRILTETWRAFGSPVANVAPGQRMGQRNWGGMNHSYFGKTNPTNYIIGAYVPSNDFAPWSGVGFE